MIVTTNISPAAIFILIVYVSPPIILSTLTHSLFAFASKIQYSVQKPEPEEKRQYQKLFKNPRILLPSVAASAVIIIAVIAFFALQPAPQHPLRIIVHAIDPYQGSTLAQVELSTVNGVSRNQTFNLIGSNQSVPIVVPRGLIHDGEPFKVCISLVNNHSRNCIIGLNHPTNQPEVVPLKVPG